MRPYQKRALLPSMLTGAGLIMACTIYAEIQARPMIEDVPSFQAAATRIAKTSPPTAREAMPRKTRFAAIVDRPLFSPTRRPPSEAVTEASMPSLDFSLLGVVTSKGEQFALIKSSTGGDPVRVQEGEDISGWTVARITSDRIVVRHDAMERELRLDFAAPAPPPPETAMPNDAQSAGQTSAQNNEPNGGKTSGQNNAQSNGQSNSEAPEPVPPPEADEPEAANKKPAN